MFKYKIVPSYMSKALFAFLLLPLVVVFMRCTEEVDPVIVYVEPEIPEIPETQYESLQVVYNPVIVSKGTDATFSPEWRDEKKDQAAESPIRSTYKLSMSDGRAAPEGISIDSTTGKITIAENAPVTPPFGLELSVSVTYTSMASGDEVTITTPFRVVVRSVGNKITLKEEMVSDQKLLTIGDADNPYLYRIDGLSDIDGVKGTIVILDDSNGELYRAEGIAAVKSSVDLGTAGVIDIVGIGPPVKSPIDIENLPKTFRITLTVYTNGDEYSSSEDTLTNGTEGATAGYKAIYSWRDLSKIKDGNDYELMNDIEFPDRGIFGFDNFKPIAPFSGTLDGKEYTISKLFIDRPNENNVGLFSQLKTGASIKDVTIEHSGIYGQQYVGALVGRINEVGFKIENVHVYALGSSVVRGGDNVGGLIGFARGDGSTSYIRGSSSHTPVSGGNEVGGMAGQFGILESTGYADFIEFSGHATGDVHGKDKTGGLFGLAINSKINGYATGNVKGNNDIGGLVGQARKVELNGYSTGEIWGMRNIGGLIGNGNPGEWETGKVNGYALGFVSGRDSAGGLVGKLLLKDEGNLVGYTRAKVQDYSMGAYVLGKITAGLLAGSGDGTQVKGYYSETESEITDLPMSIVDGIHGDPIDIMRVAEADFEGFTFGDELGEWTWVGEGKWPAINIGIQKGNEQPVEGVASPPDIDLDFPSELQGIHRLSTNVFKIAETRDAEIYRLKFHTAARQYDAYPTGLLISPGESIEVTVLENNGKDLPKLIVGTKGRFVLGEYSLNKPVNTIKNTTDKNLFLYLRFTTRNIPDQVAIVKVEGAKQAPYLIAGRTTTKEFQEQLDSLDYDLVTLVSDKFIFVIDKENILKYKDQDWSMLAILLDKVTDIAYGVNGVDGSSELHEVPPVRLLMKVVGRGYMYSTPYGGVGVHTNSAWQWIDINRIGNSWGLWHEIGHQLQVTPFWFSGTQEVYVNVYSLAIERYFGKSSRMESIWMDSNDKLKNYLNSSRADKDYFKDLNGFQRLALYEQLRLEFGDDFFPKLHKYMREHRKDYQPEIRGHLVDDGYKKNIQNHGRNENFVKIASLVSGRDLGDFFKAWGYDRSYSIFTNEIITSLPDAPDSLIKQGIVEKESFRICFFSC